MIYDFKNPEHFKKLERQAYDGTIDVSGFPPAAYRYFDSLRLLYARFKYDNLSRSEAEAQKKKLYSQYTEALHTIDGMKLAYRFYQENIKKAGTLLSDAEKSESPIQTAIIEAEIISCMTSDKEFCKRIRNKFQEE